MANSVSFLNTRHRFLYLDKNDKNGAREIHR